MNLRLAATKPREEKYLGRHGQVREERNVVFEIADRVAVTEMEATRVRGPPCGSRVRGARLATAKSNATDLDLM